MRAITVEQRRHHVARAHLLDGGARGPDEVVAAVLALHATDPASVYLSVLARSSGSTVADVAAAMYERRSLVRWMAMRRTLFVFAVTDVPVIQAAVSTPLAAALRRRLVSRLGRNGTEPSLAGDVGSWLGGVEDSVETALRARGSATGAELAADVPALGTRILPGAPSEVAQNVTTALLTHMSAEGSIVRGVPTGPWTSRHHRWQPADTWWPDGLPEVDPEGAERTLAGWWLARFGPATVDDLQWWTGWSKGTVRRILAHLEIEDVDLHGRPGVALAGTAFDPAPSAPVAALLPALDPTPMGWKDRDWFVGMAPEPLYDRTGNLAPTLWWDGEVVGGWAVAPTGEVRIEVVADRGAEATLALGLAASSLQERLGGAVITPAFRAPLERRLAKA